ncbi:HPr family phosphocarrier protein [Pelagibacterium lentulum]|uniref:Phosphocarrier protein HPr n=1 Tax=Pelagibacterium lentulum TaxID=2029865 RepID=A0A916RB94_9HYPH|nr:HPr family phosphocarrier protein [Pelagibacterium lentulum]GGA42144.1 phosphocarrier protein HPr [Pelagibacterium lentulum]
MTDPDRAICQRLTICNRRGLHARASARFVRTADHFDAKVTVTRDGVTVGGTSIMGLMMLAAGPGSTILVQASGNEARQAIEAIAELVNSGFDEDKEAASDATF